MDHIDDDDHQSTVVDHRSSAADDRSTADPSHTYLPSPRASTPDPQDTESRKRSASRIDSNSAEPPRKRQKAAHENLFDDNIADLEKLLEKDSPRRSRRDHRGRRPFFEDVTRREDALRQLEASGASKIETKALDRACRGHGQKQVQAVGRNRWQHQRMKGTLLAHQVLASAKMIFREVADVHPRGGILADCMGSGKTRVVITLIVNRRWRKIPGWKNQKTLVVVNPHLLDQWNNEIREVVSKMKDIGGITQFSMSSTKQQSSAKTAFQYAKEFLSMFGLVLTTYDQVLESYNAQLPPRTTGKSRKDLQADIQARKDWAASPKSKGPLHQINWHRVVFDEVTAIKNDEGKKAAACQALQADNRWLLSGTPFENSLDDCYAYLKLLQMPHTETLQDFRDYYLANDAAELYKVLRQIMIRRRKTDVFLGERIVDIPETEHELVPIFLSPMKAQMMRDITADRLKKARAIQHIRNLSEAQKRRKVMSVLTPILQTARHCLLNREDIGLKPREDIEALLREFLPAASSAAIMKMRKMIVDCATQWKAAKEAFKADEDGEIQAKRDLRDEYNASGLDVPGHLQEARLHPTKPLFHLATWKKEGGRLMHSSKTEAVMDRLMSVVEADPTNKILLFTQSKEIVRMLSEWLKKNKIGHETYHGDQKLKQRGKAVERFQNDPNKRIMLMTLLSGGDGLNLTAANHVFMPDPYWNYSKEEQAEFRMIRIGQRRRTYVIRFVVKGTIEEHILQKQEVKQQKIDNSLEGAEKRAGRWSLEEIVDLLQMDEKATDEAEDFFNRNVENVNRDAIKERLRKDEEEESSDDDDDEEAGDVDGEEESSEGSETDSSDSEEGSDAWDEESGRPMWAKGLNADDLEPFKEDGASDVEVDDDQGEDDSHDDRDMDDNAE